MGVYRMVLGPVCFWSRVLLLWDLCEYCCWFWPRSGGRAHYSHGSSRFELGCTHASRIGFHIRIRGLVSLEPLQLLSETSSGQLIRQRQKFFRQQRLANGV